MRTWRPNQFDVPEWVTYQLSRSRFTTGFCWRSYVDKIAENAMSKSTAKPTLKLLCTEIFLIKFSNHTIRIGSYPMLVSSIQASTSGNVTSKSVDSRTKDVPWLNVIVYPTIHLLVFSEKIQDVS